MKKRFLSALLSLCMLLTLLPVMAQAEGNQDERTVPLSWANELSKPVVSADAEKVFMDAYHSASSRREFVSLEEFYQLYGETRGHQCANCMNYYYDTGDTMAIRTVWKLIDGKRIGAEVFWLNEYTPASSSAPSTKVDVTEAPFPDVPTDAWYAEAVAAMKDSGIINGCDDGLFHPEREVKTGEFYAMLLRAGTRDGVDVTKAEGVDNDTHWAKGVLFNADMAYLNPPKKGHEDDVVLRGEAVNRVIVLRGQVEKKILRIRSLGSGP